MKQTANASVGTGPTGFYRLKRFKYLVCNIYDATLKIIAVAKVKANIVIHICSSIAWQAGARTVSQPPAPGLPRLVGRAAADDSGSMRLMLKTSETFVRHWQNRGKPESGPRAGSGLWAQASPGDVTGTRTGPQSQKPSITH